MLIAGGPESDEAEGREAGGRAVHVVSRTGSIFSKRLTHTRQQWRDEGSKQKGGGARKLCAFKVILMLGVPFLTMMLTPDTFYGNSI
jgi:hypothetical protein